MALTIRTTENDDLLIKDLCEKLQIKTASGLLLHLLRDYDSNCQRIDSLSLQNNNKRKYINNSNRVITNLFDALRDLNEHDIKDFD